VATADLDGDIEYAPLWAGQSCSVVNDLKPAATLAREASQARWSPLLAGGWLVGASAHPLCTACRRRYAKARTARAVAWNAFH
jgi:hypothetical protein